MFSKRSNIMNAKGFHTFNRLERKTIETTRMYANRMRTASSLPYGGGVSVRGGLPNRDPLNRNPPNREPRTETPLDREPLDRDPQNRDPPWQRTPGQRPPGQRPPRQRHPWSCDLWCMLEQRPPCGQTNTYENIIFSQLRLRAVKNMLQKYIRALRK